MFSEAQECIISVHLLRDRSLGRGVRHLGLDSFKRHQLYIPRRVYTLAVGLTHTDSYPVGTEARISTCICIW